MSKPRHKLLHKITARLRVAHRLSYAYSTRADHGSHGGIPHLLSRWQRCHRSPARAFCRERRHSHRVEHHRVPSLFLWFFDRRVMAATPGLGRLAEIVLEDVTRDMQQRVLDLEDTIHRSICGWREARNCSRRRKRCAAFWRAKSRVPNSRSRLAEDDGIPIRGTISSSGHFLKRNGERIDGWRAVGARSDVRQGGAGTASSQLPSDSCSSRSPASAARRLRYRPMQSFRTISFATAAANGSVPMLS